MTALQLDPSLRLSDLVPVAFLAGIGFTASLLISNIAFDGAATANTAKFAVLFASTLRAVLTTTVLQVTRRRHL